MMTMMTMMTDKDIFKLLNKHDARTHIVPSDILAYTRDIERRVVEACAKACEDMIGHDAKYCSDDWVAGVTDCVELLRSQSEVKP